MPAYLVIGNGIAGINALEAIRSLDPHSPLTLIAEEDFPPYSRPLISLVLEGALPPERLPIRPPDFYRQLEVRALVGQRVVELDPKAARVRTDRGEQVAYDRLLIASGARPRTVEAPGHELAGIFCLRTQAQVQAMRARLPGVKRAVVLGGGLVGFKAAYALLRQGIAVTMLIRSPHPLSQQVDPEAGALIRRELERHGLEVRVGVEVTAFLGREAVEAVELSDGERLACQMVVVGKGVRPALEFLPPEAVQTDGGILVDQHLRTSLEGVYAAGDVAQAHDLVRGRPWVNAIWPVAAEQGRIAGANLAGRPVVYRGSLGRNVIRIFTLDLMTAGMVNPPPDGGHQVFTHHDPRRGTYRRLVLHRQRLVGMVLLGRVEQGGVLLALIQCGLPLEVDPLRLLEPTFDFASLLP